MWKEVTSHLQWYQATSLQLSMLETCEVTPHLSHIRRNETHTSATWNAHVSNMCTSELMSARICTRVYLHLHSWILTVTHHSFSACSQFYAIEHWARKYMQFPVLEPAVAFLSVCNETIMHREPTWPFHLQWLTCVDEVLPICAYN